MTTLKANPGELRIAGPCLSAGWDMSLDSTVLFLSSFLTARLAGQFPTVAGCGPPQVPHLAGMCLQAVPGLAGQSTTRQICSVPSWGPAHIKQHGGWSPQALKLRWPSWQHLGQTVSTPVSQYCSVLYRDPPKRMPLIRSFRASSIEPTVTTIVDPFWLLFCNSLELRSHVGFLFSWYSVPSSISSRARVRPQVR